MSKTAVGHARGQSIKPIGTIDEVAGLFGRKLEGNEMSRSAIPAAKQEMNGWRRFQMLVLNAFVILALIAFVTPRYASAADHLTVGFPSLSMSTILPHIAQDLGYFDKEGLDVTIQHFESGSINMKALLSGAEDLADVETSAILAAVASGADLRIIGTHEWGLHFAFYATRDINSLNDLSGKRFAISGVGGLPHLVILALLKQQQIDPGKVQMLVVGGQLARLKALIAGKVDATVGEESPEVEADPKLHRLFIVRDRLPLYLSQAIAVSPMTLKTKADAIAKFQRSLIRAARFAYRDKKEFLKLASRHLARSEKDLESIYDFYVRVQHWSINGDVPLDRIRYMQELGLATKVQKQPVDLKKLIDTESIDRILVQEKRVALPN
jgi:NitT/TauT family transport system substrate-binding protein